MTFNKRLFRAVIVSFASLWLFMFCATGAFAQRGGTGAKGGSTRPERAERPSPTPEPLFQPPPPSPSPAASPGTVVVTESQPSQAIAEDEEEKAKPGTDPGTYFFLYGVNASARPRHEEGTATRVVGGFAFNVYVTRRIFVEIDNDNFVSRRPLGGERSTGVGDTALIIGGDAVLENRETAKPNVSFFYGIKVPTASSNKGLGSGEIDHVLFGTVNKNLRGRMSKSFVELDFSEYFAGRGGGDGFAKSSSLAVIFRQWLSDKKTNRFHFEVGGTFATKESNAEMYTLDYFEHFPNERMSFRLGGRFGLTPNVPRAGLYVALTFNGKF